MGTDNRTLFEDFLASQDEEAWAATVTTLLRSIHEVDKTATQIWFAFYPISLFRALEQAQDQQQLVARLLMQGKYLLRDQIDSSHRFFYGHRYWPEVKRSVEEYAQASKAGASSSSLAEQITEVAHTVAERLKVEESLLIAITAVAFMTLRQAGLEAFKAAPGVVSVDKSAARRSPEQVLKERAVDDGQGLFGFLKTVDKEWSVTYDESAARAKYKVISGEDLASGSARDKTRDWRAVDSRCIEGPIPVECRSASCGTCWVGILGGAEKLSDVSAREGKKIKEFGYIDTNEPRPVIRLACMAEATGAVSIVIPPWNGVFGKYLRAMKAGTNETLEEIND